MAKLILDNLNKSYGNFQALKNFSLTIEDGELIVIEKGKIIRKIPQDKIVEELSNIVGPERLVVSQPGPGIKIWNE